MSLEQIKKGYLWF